MRLISPRYHKKRDGILRVLPNGHGRYLKWWERIWLRLGGEP